MGPKIGLFQPPGTPIWDPLLEGYMGPNHIDARLGHQIHYGVLAPFGVPHSGVPPQMGYLGVPPFWGYPHLEHPRWRYGETGVWGLGASPKPHTPYSPYLQRGCAVWALGPRAQGPIPSTSLLKGSDGAKRSLTPHGMGHRPSHTTRARVMCARARARAPAE